MKRKIVFSVLSLVTVGVVTFASYKTFYQNKNVVDLMLGENIEALTYGEGGGSGFYQRSSGSCPSPCGYKKWVSCKSGGHEECYASDCC